jgi:hypothetical protein
MYSAGSSGSEVWLVDSSAGLFTRLPASERASEKALSLASSRPHLQKDCSSRQNQLPASR